MATPKEESLILGWRPHLIRSAVVSLVQSLFSDANVIRDPILKSYVWTSDSTTTKIKIDTAGHLSLQNLKLQAHIAAVLGVTTFPKILQGSDLYSKLSSTGTQIRTFLAITPLTLQCFGQTEEFALILNSEVGIRLREAAKFIEDWNDWKHFSVKGLGAPSRVRENEEEYVAGVPTEIHVEHASTIDADMLPTSLAADYDAY